MARGVRWSHAALDLHPPILIWTSTHPPFHLALSTSRKQRIAPRITGSRGVHNPPTCRRRSSRDARRAPGLRSPVPAQVACRLEVRP